MALTLAHVQIGWISALSIEALLAETMLDELIEQTISLPPNDNNIYRYGRIKINGSDASHIVAIAQLPLSTTGKASAATVANNMHRTFPNLKFGIMVGIAGGVWTAKEDLRLGDIVVGVPDDGGPGIIQYDLGKSVQDGELVTKGNMNKAPDVLRSAAGVLQRKHMQKPGDYVSSLEIAEVKRYASRPSVDNLFTKAYIHRGGGSCENCDKAHLITRPQRLDLNPKVHYGAIASGDQVVKDAVFAAKIRAKHKIICFEMEAAGLDAFPCLVIRGISDYADTHKNNDWHAYAAASAAAYAKELLSIVPLTDVAELPHTGNTHWNVPRAPNPLFTGRQALMNDMKKHLIAKPNKNDRPVFVLQGIGGAGKSEAAIKFATENQDNFWGIFWIDADNKQSVEQGFTEIAKMQTPPLIDTTSKGVLRWLANIKESWLLILDNCDDSMMDFAAYMPSRGGSIILTTRLTECKILGTWANLDDLGRDTATQLLLRASGYGRDNQEAHIPAAEAVVSSLGQHALALVHAGAYIKKGLCTLDEYVPSFRKEQARLMKFKPQQQASRYGSVYATFEVSAEALASSADHDCALALRLLNLLAFLNREAVEEDIFSRASDQCHKMEKAWEKNGMQCPKCPAVSSTEYDRVTDELARIDHLHIWHCEKARSSGVVENQATTRLRFARTRLADLSLIRVDDNKISMHPLVHEWAQTRLDKTALTTAWEQTVSILALSAVDLYCPGHEERRHEEARDLVNDMVQSTEMRYGKMSSDAFEWQVRLAELHSEARDYQGALTLFETLYERYSQLSILKDLQMECLFENLVLVHKNLGNSEQAICFAEKNFQLWKTNSPDSTRRLQALAMLTVLYIHEHTKKAVALLEDNITLYYKTSSPNPHWIIIMMVLAQGYIRLNKPDGAMSHLAQARFQLDRFLADDTPPPWLAPAMGLVADIYFALEEFSIGATVLEKRVNLQSSYLRLDDNRRLSSLRKLAQVYTRLDDSRKLKQVVELLEEVIDDGQETIHTDFKDSKLTEKVLAYAQWNLAQARRTRQSVVGIRDHQSGQKEAASNLSASAVARDLTIPPQGWLLCAEVADLHTDQSSRRAKENKAVLGDRSRLGNSSVSSTPMPSIVNPSAAEATGIPGYLRETTASRRAREARSQAKAEVPRSATSKPKTSSTKASATSSSASKISSGAAGITNPRTGPTTSATASATYTGWYAIPQKGIPANRAQAIAYTRQNFGYGPAVAGGPFFPNGTLGNTFIQNDIATLQAETGPQMSDTSSDTAKAESDASKYNGLKTLQDYTLLYDQEWTATLSQGPAPGILTNYTQDLLFSMERLSFSPYQIRRLNSSKDTLNFKVDDKTAKNITGMTQQQLFTSGRLFYADYRDQAKLVATTDARYSAAVDAYFYINQTSGNFLPLAIRTNQGANLIYTPADSQNDWLLAKMMYNVCDLWFAQWEHLARTHEVVQIVYMAAIRTLSDDHPVKAILDRLMYEVFAIQPLAASILFAPGGVVDEAFPYTYGSAQNYSSNYYFTRSGFFQSGYFLTDLKNRGLINATTGPQLKNFPYYEDASVIYSAIRTFMTSFVSSYYSQDSVVAADTEIQAWVKECNGPAKVMDFPTAITKASTLIDVLTHMAHLSSTAHHTVNTNELMSASATLPFHAMSLYSPVPKQKGVTNLVAFLPPLKQAEEQIGINSLFSRNYLAGTNRTLSHMFDDAAMLKRMNVNTRNAATTFMNSMNSFSSKVKARTFDSKGLSQGMPFVWKALDPNVAPFGVTV
ncbi:Lipoxygenase, partial [Aureobasidium melanogenum]